jgi:V/A-type H+-transporting ATPase subunit I
MDISAWFLIFFSVFVAIIIGDAGYGALILGTSGYFLVRSARKSGEIPLGTVLFTVLGASTVIWGAITGTWFGYEPIGESPLLSWMVIEPIDSFNPRSRDVVQWICFILAAAHLSIAHLWNFFLELRSKPWYRAFAQLGWLAVLVGLYYLVLNLVLGQPLQMFGVYSILAGLGVVLLFSQHQEGDSFFKGVGRGLNGINTFTILLDGISAFSDVVSYLRLFAVGLATVEIAKSFNSMAAGMMDVGAAGIVGAILVLFLGHSINLIMAALSVVVHGIRLNLLEFTRHLGMEWSGIPYRPFRRGQHAS